MFCGKCGSQVENGVEFCPVCGNRLLDDRNPSAPSPGTYSVYENLSLDSNSKLEKWCNFLLTFLRIFLFLEIFGSIAGGVSIIAEDDDFLILGAAVIIFGPLLSLLSNALIMIFVYMARDIAAIRASLSNKNMRQ